MIDVIRTEGLTRKFRSLIAVDSLNLAVKEGEIFGLVDPDGAGKTTTMRLLTAILEPTSGEAWVDGHDIVKDAESVKEKIGYMSQRFSLYDDLTVEENITFFSGIYRIPREKKSARKEWVLEMADLREQRALPTAALPSGWKQRLALGCALLHEPPIVFLDEPTSGVDPINRRQFWDLIHNLAAQGVTVFVTTHYMDEAEYCDRIALIYRGELIAIGAPASLKTTMMKEDVLEVVCADPILAMSHVEGLAGVREIALFGNALHLVVEKSAAVEQSVRQSLKENHIDVIRMEKIVPSMEDMFVSLIEARDREEGAGEEVHA